MNSLAIKFGRETFWPTKALIVLMFYSSHLLNQSSLIGLSPVLCVGIPLYSVDVAVDNNVAPVNVNQLLLAEAKDDGQSSSQALAYRHCINCSVEVARTFTTAPQMLLSPQLPVSLLSSKAPLKLSLLSRPKRYLSFPEGSSFSVAVCFTVGIIGNPRYNYMSFGLNWGVAYDLPNTTWILNHLHGFAKSPVPLAEWHRRSRRSLYDKIERIVDNMGYNGRDCVLRALCESRQYFQSTKMGMIGEMLRAIFSLPKQQIHRNEFKKSSDIATYDKAYRSARSLDIDCSAKYDCNFSLIELAFGQYSTPPEGYYNQH